MKKNQEEIILGSFCLFFRLAIVFFIIFCMIAASKICNNKHSKKAIVLPAKASEANNVDGWYGDYALESYNGDRVYVKISSRKPEVFIKALSDAVKKAEEKSKKKVVSMQSGGTYASAVLYLSPIEQ